MKVEMSKFLQESKTRLKELVGNLGKDFKYVSVLGSDTTGTKYQVTQTGASIGESNWSERGFVARVYNGIGYSEYSFNTMDDLSDIEKRIKTIAKSDVDNLKSQGMEFVEYPVIEEDEISESFYGEVEKDPEAMSPKDVINTLTDLKNEGMSLAEFLIDFRAIYESVKVCKVFISSNKDLEQSYNWVSSYLIPIGRNEEGVKYAFKGFSGMKGAEILDEMHSGLQVAVNEVKDLLSAERLSPGEYDIICDPDMAGLIAHEAFGHGVEMDMFVKQRAKAVEFVDKAVAANGVRMHDGAKSATEVSSYLFDDEGTIGTDTVVIDDGILKSGISDLLSAMKLGTVPTGNGKRESFERKVYARMTNTFFSPGESTLDEMVKSIENGYLLEGFQSGMEDPKNWGIQCVAMKGREIIDGKLTGKIVAPVYLTGYVPDLLKSISMVSKDFKLSGTGACGKGYKEFVKTSTGGPYLKAKGRLA
jgi:TldD protein